MNKELVDTLQKMAKEISALKNEVNHLKRLESGGGGVTDHGALTGLADNDHPQYLLKTGKATDSDKLDGLDSTAFSRPVFLTSPLKSTSWDGDAYSTTAKTKIDLSSVFGAPAGIKAALFNVALRDSGSAANECLMSLSPSSSVGGLSARCSGIANDKFVNACLVVPCDANGDVYYDIAASGSGTMDVYLQIYGYWL